MMFSSDSDRYCRECNGQGFVKYDSGYDTTIYEDCDRCEGTGNNGITLVKEKSNDI
jgi:excinuclease UvrABC ATPase subunit